MTAINGRGTMEDDPERARLAADYPAWRISCDEHGLFAARRPETGAPGLRLLAADPAKLREQVQHVEDIRKEFPEWDVWESSSRGGLYYARKPRSSPQLVSGHPVPLSRLLQAIRNAYDEREKLRQRTRAERAKTDRP
jgi:hypothetical protein